MKAVEPRESVRVRDGRAIIWTRRQHQLVTNPTGITRVRDHGMYTKIRQELGRSLRSRERMFEIKRQDLKLKSLISLLKEVRCSRTERLSEVGGLNLNLEKSGIIRFSQNDPEGDIPFLGFVIYWGRGRSKKIKLLKVKTAAKRLAQCIQGFKEWIKLERHRYTTKKLWKLASQKLHGHYNYYGVSYNRSKLQYFYHSCVMLLFKWLNRRSQKRSWTWQGFKTRLKFNQLPLPPSAGDLINVESRLGSELKRKPKSRMRKSRTYGSERSRGHKLPLFT